MKKIVRLFGIVGLVLAGSSLVAGSIGETSERIQVNPKPQKKQVKKHSKGAAAIRHAEKQEKSPLGKVWVSSSAKFVYLIKNIGAKGKTLTTTDETIWEISGSDASKLANWTPNSPIVITPNYSWFSSYDYILQNKWSNESVRANLSQGPFVKHAVFIQQIDTQFGAIRLSNGTTWKASVSKDFRS